LKTLLRYVGGFKERIILTTSYFIVKLIGGADTDHEMLLARGGTYSHRRNDSRRGRTDGETL